MVLNRLRFQQTSWLLAIHLHLATTFLTMKPGQRVLKGNWGGASIMVEYMGMGRLKLFEELL